MSQSNQISQNLVQRSEVKQKVVTVVKKKKKKKKTFSYFNSVNETKHWCSELSRKIEIEDLRLLKKRKSRRPE